MFKAISQTLLSVALSVAVILGLVHSVPQAHADFSQLRMATWQLKGDSGSCSGVMIEKNLYLTAAHCAQENMKVNGKPASMLKRDESRDLMILAVIQDCPCVPVSGVSPEQDQRLIVVGYPLGVQQIVTEGRYQGLFVEDAKMFLHTAPTIFGNSGGPIIAVVDGEYKVVGVVSGIFLYGSIFGAPLVVGHMGLAASTESINEFLK